MTFADNPTQTKDYVYNELAPGAFISNSLREPLSGARYAKCACFGLIMYLFFVAGGHASSYQSRHLTCELEENALFLSDPGANNGPAYFGRNGGAGLDLRAKNDSNENELQIQDNADQFVTKNNGAKFMVDTIKREIDAVPFGTLNLRIIERRPSNKEYSKILSPGTETLQDGNYALGFFDKDSNIINSVIMIHPQKLGLRIFTYMNFGELLFGYCMATDK